jgi:transposase-like protein
MGRESEWRVKTQQQDGRLFHEMKGMGVATYPLGIVDDEKGSVKVCSQQVSSNAWHVIS